MLTPLAKLRRKFKDVRGSLDERGVRMWVGAEARALGHGGQTLVAKATGVALSTVAAGVKELATSGGKPLAGGRVRRPGAGRKKLTEENPGLLPALDALVEPVSRGDPMSPLRWTCKSTHRLAAELRAQGHQISASKVWQLLRETGYSLQSTRKTREGSSHPDRDAQFHFINETVKTFQRSGQPVISVDTKKKELVGDFKNNGREWAPQGSPPEVRVHDFIDDELGKVIPYGIYDVRRNEGWVNVGVDHDTPEFAVESIRRWWQLMGSPEYPKARKLLIMADGGGSNSSRARAWKTQLQRLADDTGLDVSVRHFPPGTSKWNKIEHRLFAHITQNWRGRPLLSREVVVNLIAATTTRTGLRVRAALDTGTYATGAKISKAEFAAVRLERDEFHGEWNYTVLSSGRTKK